MVATFERSPILDRQKSATHPCDRRDWGAGRPPPPTAESSDGHGPGGRHPSVSGRPEHFARPTRSNGDGARNGADLYVTGEQFGRASPLPLALVSRIAAIPGVTAVIPRVVGRDELGTERVPAIVVGRPLEQWPAGIECVDGRLHAGNSRDELIVGTDLAQKLNLRVGSLLPPFYRSRLGERVSEVVGLFRSDAPAWQAPLC